MHRTILTWQILILFRKLSTAFNYSQEIYGIVWAESKLCHNVSCLCNIDLHTCIVRCKEAILLAFLSANIDFAYFCFIFPEQVLRERLKNSSPKMIFNFKSGGTIQEDFHGNYSAKSEKEFIFRNVNSSHSSGL